MPHPIPRHGRAHGFTLIELMIVIALVAIIAALAGPPLGDLVKMQRLRGVAAQVATDLAFARSEAVGRGSFVQLRVQNATSPVAMSCYVIYTTSVTNPWPSGPTPPSLCDCTQAAGSRCTGADVTEVKTVQLPLSESISLVEITPQPDVLTFDPRDGTMWVRPGNEDMTQTLYRVDTQIDSARRIRAWVKQSGRAQSCAPPGSTINMPTC